MTPRAKTLIAIAFALLVFAFHIRLKKGADPKMVEQLAAISAKPLEWQGRVPADFELTKMDGQKFKLSEHAGKEVIVLNFFATWCAPCRAEMPELERFRAKWSKQPLTLLAIDGHEAPDVVAGYLKATKLTMPVAIDAGTVAASFGVDSYPTTVVIGAGGRVVLYETTPIMNSEITLQPVADAEVQTIRAGKGITTAEFLAASAKEQRPATHEADSTSVKLAGRKLAIAKAMYCACGCSNKLADCNCHTGEGMKIKLRDANIDA